ncbi:MAG: hypothetical protein JOY94_09790 [Methylobacteriaceae bacterium]|nr:hypothetical protein [Methylobacteriaceae bacterium]
MSFLKSLFGRKSAGGGDAPAAAATVKQLEYKDFLVRAAPFRAEGQFQTAGVIEKEVEGVRKEHRFVRADRFASIDEAADFALTKGRQIIDERGERLFG